MDFTQYTERQNDIIEGKIPPYHVMTIEFRRLHAKAMFAFDGDVVRIAEKELKRRNVRLTERKPYTEKQLKVISGERPINEVSKSELATIYHKARDFGDLDIGKTIEAELSNRGWKPTISGYNTIQTAIIIGTTDINTVHDNALRGIRKVALILGDIDVVIYMDRIYKKRGLRRSESETDQLEDIEFLIKQGMYGSFKDYELNYARHLISRLGKFPMIEEAIKTEIENRSFHIRLQKYSEQELEIINGITPVSDLRPYSLQRLKDKIELDDTCDMSELIENINAEIKRQEVARQAHLDALKNDYTDRQRKIVDGLIPLYREKTDQLKVILRKAEIKGESEKASFIKAEVEAREKNLSDDGPYNDLQQMLINSIKKKSPSAVVVEESPEPDDEEYKEIALEYGRTYNGYAESLRNKVRHLRDEEYEQTLKEEKKARPYTRRQRLILDGAIPLSSVKDYEISKLIDKAEAFSDTQYIEILEGYREEKNNERQSLINGDGVARGEIPYEEISAIQLVRLSKQAKKAGDTELYELLQTLIIEKKNDYKEKNKVRPRNPFYRKYANASPQKYKYDGDKAKDWAIDILESRLYPFYCEMTDLQDIRLFADTLEDPAYGKVARFLINERKDRSIVYAAQSKEDALQLINQNSWYQVERPEEWGERKNGPKAV